MRTMVMVFCLTAALTVCARAEDGVPQRYKLYSLKGGNSDVVLLLDSATGRTWQVFSDNLGKVTRLSAITVEGLVYAPKDKEQFYAEVKSFNVEGLSTSDSATKDELERLYGYGLDANQLAIIRDKIKALQKR